MLLKQALSMYYICITEADMTTATISFRISSEIKNSAKLILKNNGMSISELCQNVLEYVAETGKIPVKKKVDMSGRPRTY